MRAHLNWYQQEKQKTIYIFDLNLNCGSYSRKMIWAHIQENNFGLYLGENNLGSYSKKNYLNTAHTQENNLGSYSRKEKTTSFLGNILVT